MNVLLLPVTEASTLGLDSPGSDLALLANLESHPTIRAVPLRRACGNVGQSDAFEMEPLLVASLCGGSIVKLLFPNQETKRKGGRRQTVQNKRDGAEEKLTSLSHWIMVPKLTPLQIQYLGSLGSTSCPSSSTSRMTPPALDAAAFFFLGAAFRRPTALLPPELVRLTTPGAGRFCCRLLTGRAGGAASGGAGVFRAVLARRGRSAARDGRGSWLVAFPREAGRRVVSPEGTDCGASVASTAGVAGRPAEDAGRDGGFVDEAAPGFAPCSCP